MTDESPQVDLKHLRTRSLLVAVVAALLCALGAWLSLDQFLGSYLFAVVFWVGLSLGCVVLTLIHHLVGGFWGLPLRRILEAGAWPILFMLVLFVPVLLGIERLYEWADPSEALLLHDKVLYLNEPFFIGRTIGYFVVWALIALLLNVASKRQDRVNGLGRSALLKRFSGPGMILYFLTATFAAVDWLMSLDPHWFSSIYGVIVMVGQGLSALAFSIVCVSWLSRRTPLGSQLRHAPLIDIGNLLMAGVVLWAYVSFSQYLIIWSGNTAEEVPWYVQRRQGGWQWVAVALALFHFVVPFVLLLMRDIKQNIARLGMVAGLIVAMHAVDIYWLIMPSLHKAHPWIHWLDAVAFLAVGAVWMFVFLLRLEASPLLPAAAATLAAQE